MQKRICICFFMWYVGLAREIQTLTNSPITDMNIVSQFLQQQAELAESNANNIASIESTLTLEDFQSLVVLNLNVYKSSNLPTSARAFLNKLTLEMYSVSRDGNSEKRFYLSDVTNGKNPLGKRMKRFLNK